MEKIHSKKLFILRGIPGSGKSTVSNYLLQNHGMQILDPDKIDIFSSEFRHFKSTFPKLTRLKNLKYRFLLNIAIQNINSNKSFVWDQPWRKSKSIETMLNCIKFQNLVNEGWAITIIELLITPDMAWERLKKVKSYKVKIFKTYKSFKYYCAKFSELANFDESANILRLDANQSLEETSLMLETLFY